METARATRRKRKNEKGGEVFKNVWDNNNKKGGNKPRTHKNQPKQEKREKAFFCTLVRQKIAKSWWWKFRGDFDENPQKSRSARNVQ